MDNNFIIEITTRSLSNTFETVLGSNNWGKILWLFIVFFVGSCSRYIVRILIKKFWNKEMKVKFWDWEMIFGVTICSAMLLVLVFCFNFFKTAYSINVEYKQQIYDLQNKLNKLSNKKEPQEKIKVEAKLVKYEHQNEYEVIVSVINSGDKEIVLDKAKLYCGDELIGEDNSIQWVKSDYSDNKLKITDSGYYRLKPGDKAENVANFENIYVDRKNHYLKSSMCYKKKYVEIFTTLGNKFKGDVIE